jgi:YidC/Oxa1 family membrane protein insertase
VEFVSVEPRQSGGFDRRTILALVLMGVIWVIFTQFLIPKPKPTPPAATEAAVPQEVAGAPTAAAESEAVISGGAGRTLQNRLPAEEREIRVDGERFRAVFGTRGAGLLSWKLADFTDASGAPVELVAPGNSGALDLRIETPDGPVDLSRTVFSAEEGEETAEGSRRVRVVRFVAEGPLVGNEGEGTGRDSAMVRVERVFRVDPARYDLQMEIRVAGIENPRLDHRLVVGWEAGLPSQEIRANDERPHKAAVALLGQDLIKDGFGGGGFGCSCSGGKAARGGERSYEGTLRWAGVRGKYFAGILVPETEGEARMVAGSDPAAGRVGMRLHLPLADERGTVHRFTVYAGPIDYRTLKELDGRLACDITRIVDFGGKWIAPISKATHWFLVTVGRAIPNYGIVILILALFVRVIFHPLTVKSLRSQRKLQMLKPELDRINAEYKDQPEVRTKKIMELHKTHGVNPLGGCLPLLVQMPVIWALYNVLMNAIELRKAPFGLWMRDLSAPDTVGRLFGIPINPLPLLMALTMFWQQKLTPTDPRQAPMLLLMPLMMTFFFYSLPSGLVLYWTVTNLLAIAQQMMMKPVPALEFAGAAGTASETTRTARRKKRSAT